MNDKKKFFGDGRQVRRFVPSGVQLRDAASGEGEGGSGRTITGYAIRFNEESVVLGDIYDRFIEKISPEAVTEDFLRQCDVKMTLFHNRERLLARWNKGQGSLKLGVDAQGVYFEFEAPETDDGDRCVALLQRGDLTGCSFMFAVGDYEVEEKDDGTFIITHRRFDWLGEMTIESDPAYQGTSAQARNAPDVEPDTVSEEQEVLERKARLYGILCD